MPVWTEPGGRGEVELGSSRIDEEVVLEIADFARAFRIGVARGDVWPSVLRSAGSMQFEGERLMKLNTFASIHGGKREGDLLRGHLTDAYPDVRWDPIPLRVGRHHDDFVLLAKLPTQV